MEEEFRENLRHALGQSITISIGLLEAIVVFLVAALLARVLRRRVRSRLRSALAPENTKRIAENAATFGVYAGAATIVLTLWGATWATLLTAIGLSTLFVALGFQSVLQSVVAGIFILFERPFNVGDRVSFSVHQVGGTVEEIDLRTTVIRAEDGTRIVAPNSFVLTQAVLNFSPDRAVLTIITVYGAGGSGRTTAETRQVTAAALADVPGLNAHLEVTARSRLARLHVPSWLARHTRGGAWAAQVLQTVVDQTTQLRVTWSGVNDQLVRDEVLHRLHKLFPDGRTGVRRW